MELRMIACSIVILAIVCKISAQDSVEAGSAKGAKPGRASTETVKALSYEVLYRGSDGGQRKAPLRIARSEKEFAVIWRDAVGSRDAIPMPEVDFSTTTVVAVFMGRKSTGGYGYSVAGVSLDDEGHMTLALNAYSPGRGQMVTMAYTSPFIIITLPLANGNPIVTIRPAIRK